MQREAAANYLSKTILYGVHFLAFATPLVFLPATYSVFDLAKSTILQVGAIFLFSCWVCKQILSSQPKLNHTKLDFPILVFLASAMLSTLTSVHFLSSIFGSTGRYEGLLTLLSYGLLFFLVTQTFSDDRKAWSLLNTMIVGATFVAVYGSIQFLGYDFFAWTELFEKHRSFSTIGNPVLLAGYLVLVLPISLGAYLKTERLVSAIYYGASSLLIFATIVTTFSRGGWVAALIGMTVFALLAGSRTILSRKMGLLILIGICAVLVVFVINQRALSSSPERDGISLLERLSSIPKLKEGSINTRLLIWRGALGMIRKRPLQGWGPETFWLAFGPFGSDQLARATRSAESPDNAHNHFLQIGSTLGMVGLSSFLAILICVFGHGWRLTKNRDRLLYGSLLAGLGGYVAYLQTGVNVVSSGTIFWAGTGLIFAQPELSKLYECNLWKKPGFLKFGVLGPVSGTLLIAMVFLLRLFFADVHFAKAQRTERSSRNLSYIAEEYDLALRLNPYEASYASRAGIFYADQLAKTGNGTFFPKAVSAFVRAEGTSPLDYGNYGLLGGLYLFAAENLDPVYYSAAEEELRRALELQPFWAASRFRLGVCYFDTSRFEEALREFRLAERIDPRIAETQLYLGRLHEKKNEREEALRAYRKTLELRPDSKEAREALARLSGRQ